jgi:hypothetical protein
MSRIFDGDVDISKTWLTIGCTDNFRLLAVLDQWHEAQRHTAVHDGRPLPDYDKYEEKHAHVGAKYVRLDVGTFGAWMLEIATGDIFSIKAYGQVDRNKCAGNILDPAFNGEVLFRDRFRRGRFDNRKVQS